MVRDVAHNPTVEIQSPTVEIYMLVTTANEDVVGFSVIL